MTDQHEKDEQFRLLGGLVNSTAWREVLAPNIAGLQQQDLVTLASHKRGDFPDDFLRGRIAAFQWLLQGLPQTIAEYEQEKLKATDLSQPPVGHPYGEDNPPEEI